MTTAAPHLETSSACAEQRAQRRRKIVRAVGLFVARVLLALAVVGMVGIMAIYYATEPQRLMQLNRRSSAER